LSENNIIQFAIAVEGGLGPKVWNLYDVDSGFEAVEFSEKNLEAGHIYNVSNVVPVNLSTQTGNYEAAPYAPYAPKICLFPKSLTIHKPLQENAKPSFGYLLAHYYRTEAR
jgi:hypothetical protein